MRKFFLALMTFVLIAALHGFSQANLAGTYRCVSYNVGGGGGSAIIVDKAASGAPAKSIF